MSPILTSGLPLVRSINAVSLTKAKRSIGVMLTVLRKDEIPPHKFPPTPPKGAFPRCQPPWRPSDNEGEMFSAANADI
jgi:hypothetical protein